MHCSICGTDTPFPAPACQVCHTPFPRMSGKTDSETISQESFQETRLGPTSESETVLATDAPTIRSTGRPLGRAAGPLASGMPFGSRYRIIRELGAGGMGVVYQAWDEELGVPVALKVIRTEVTNDPNLTRDVERRFKRELLLARQVTHSHVVRIYDLGEVDGIKYITMMYVEGVDLATLIQREGRLAVPRALRMVRGVVSGLRAAHDAGVVHRDLKPANIMIDEQDEARIMDFGIARSTSLAPGTRAAPGDDAGKLFELRQQAAALMTGTMEGGVVGTIEYMAPEQARGEEVDQRADLYALGLIMYDMLGGAGRAARSESALVELTGRMERQPEDIRSLNPDVPEALGKLISRCLQPDAKARHATTKDLEADLQRLDDEGHLLPVLRRVSTRQLLGASALTVALLAGTWWLAYTPPVAAAREPMPVLVGDFDNRSGDPVFDGGVEQALGIALEGASYITVFKSRDARAIISRLGRGERITQETGQLVARSEGIKVLVNGAIDKDAGGYRIEVRAIDPLTGTPITTATRSVRDKSQVLKTIASMAESVREALGESKSQMPEVAAAETVSAGSLEAMAAYARGQELNYAGRQTEALKAFEEAVKLDPGLARAYAGMGVIYGALKQDAKAEESYKKALSHLDRMSEREKYRTYGGYYLLVTHNYEGAIKNYEKLVELYPADDTGHANLAYAYLNVRDLPKAVAEGKKAIDIYPNNTLQRTNYAMFSMYAGDFKTAIDEARKVLKTNPTFEYAMLTVANAQVGAGDLDAARESWSALEAVSPLGASMASLGRGDLAMVLGRHREAQRMLADGARTDEKAASVGEAAAKYVALAEAYQSVGNRTVAVVTARKAASLREHESVLFPAAVVLMDSGSAADAQFATELAAKLENLLQPQTSSYARLILGYGALKQKRLGDALTAFRDAQKLHDSWFAHLMLGRVYLEANRFAEAVAEFELCVKRKGEVTDVFFENISTSRYLPPVYYWLGRAQQGLGASPAARASYEQFVKLRAQSDPADPLAADATARLKKF